MTIFDQIVSGEMKAWKIWEDDNYLAFLTPFPNTPGASVVIPKNNPGDYVFDMEDDAIAGLMSAAKKAAKLISKGLGVARIAVVFEGEAVPYVHVKLFPMHGLGKGQQPAPSSDGPSFFETYPGHILTKDGPRMDDARLDEIQSKIVEAGK